MAWPCVWVEDTGDATIGLRRYRSSGPGEPECPRPGGWRYHGAIVEIGRERGEEDERGSKLAIPVERFAEDPRWPDHCECGEPFVDSDKRQVWQERIFRAADGREWNETKLPPGAMLDGQWHPQKGPDGIALVVVLPPDAEDTRGHWWHVDGPSRSNGVSGPGWTRTGDPRAVPPTVTANPSILTDSYHGWLRDGVLTDPV